MILYKVLKVTNKINDFGKSLPVTSEFPHTQSAIRVRCAQLRAHLLGCRA